MVEITRKEGLAFTRYYNGGDIDVYLHDDGEIVFPGDVYYVVDEIDDLIEILQQIKKDAAKP